MHHPWAPGDGDAADIWASVESASRIVARALEAEQCDDLGLIRDIRREWTRWLCIEGVSPVAPPPSATRMPTEPLDSPRWAALGIICGCWAAEPAPDGPPPPPPLQASMAGPGARSLLLSLCRARSWAADVRPRWEAYAASLGRLLWGRGSAVMADDERGRVDAGDERRPDASRVCPRRIAWGCADAVRELGLADQLSRARRRTRAEARAAVTDAWADALMAVAAGTAPDAGAAMAALAGRPDASPGAPARRSAWMAGDDDDGDGDGDAQPPPDSLQWAGERARAWVAAWLGAMSGGERAEAATAARLAYESNVLTETQRALHERDRPWEQYGDAHAVHATDRALGAAVDAHWTDEHIGAMLLWQTGPCPRAWAASMLALAARAATGDPQRAHPAWAACRMRSWEFAMRPHKRAHGVPLLVERPGGWSCFHEGHMWVPESDSPWETLALWYALCAWWTPCNARADAGSVPDSALRHPADATRPLVEEASVELAGSLLSR